MELKYQYHVDGTLPNNTTDVWVFGSNLLGRHGAGAALVAHKNYGYPYGLGVGYHSFQDNTQAYGIPTKSMPHSTMELNEIKNYVDDFIDYAQTNKSKVFFVTRVGCFLARYKDKDIAPMFYGAPSNCNFAESWKQYLE